MKRMACPACGKSLLVMDGQPGKRLPCPECKKQLVLAAGGLAVDDKSPPQPPTPAVRPKPAMVPVTAPIRAHESFDFKPPPPVAAPVPPFVERPKSHGNSLPPWFVSVVVGASSLAALAAMVAVVIIQPIRSEPEDGEVPGPIVVERSDPSGRTSDRPRARPVGSPRPNSDQLSRGPGAAAPPVRRGASAEAPKAKSAAKPRSASSADDDPIQAVLGSVAVVAVCGEGVGSGFVAAPRILVTNHHVIEDAVIRDLQITFPDNHDLGGQPLRAQLIHVSIPDDLAFLAIDAEVRPLSVKAQYEHVNGQRVVAVGSPGSGDHGPTLENLTTDGRLGPEITLDDDRTRWALSMAVNGGNSGGPLVDAQTGEVMGVIAAKFTKTEAQSLAIPHAALVRELARAGQSSENARKASLSLHRQRYCLRSMARILGVTSFAFDRSIAAAAANSGQGERAMDAAFNESKALAARMFAEQFADFSGTVGGEVEDLQDDPNCDPRVRRGLRKLLSDIEEHADEIRRTVPRNEIGAFLGRFRGSVEASRALVVSLAERLQLERPEEE